MDEFRTIAKLYPSGVEIDLGTDSNNVTVPATFSRHAANFVTSMDGTQQYQFLFWNTGRHITNKRRVRWNFSIGGWGVWTATRWYGIPGVNGPGSKDVHVDGFALGADSLFSDTAINAAASTWPSGAYPNNGSDKDVSTAKGAVEIAAKSPFHNLIFSQWLQIYFGGDDTGEYVETDTGASMGSSGFFDAGSGTFDEAQNGSAIVLAAYGDKQKVTKPGIGGVVVAGGGFQPGPISPGDPVPWEVIKQYIDELMQASKPGAASAPDYQSFIERAGGMSAQELKRAKQSLETSLDLGKTALGAINAQMKKRGK